MHLLGRFQRLHKVETNAKPILQQSLQEAFTVRMGRRVRIIQSHMPNSKRIELIYHIRIGVGIGGGCHTDSKEIIRNGAARLKPVS